MTTCSRRNFLKGAVATGAAIGLTPDLMAFRWFGRKPSLVDPDRKLNIACVGCGGKGASDIAGVSSENIVGLCDVDFGRARDTFSKYPDARTYRDYRSMLQDLGDDIDAVTISTPDHMHFPIAMMAMHMGKHVYVQKPCAHTIAEARELARAAKAYGVVTQMGNQGHATDDTRRIVAWIREGAIGEVREVHLYTDRPIWPQNGPMPEAATPPASMDWNLWLGTAPYRPYPADGPHFRWRGWWDYGCGALGDMGCHIMDAAFWALDLRNPLWVEAVSDAASPDLTPSWSIVTYQFGARGNRPPLKLVWHDGGKMPPRPPQLEEGRSMPPKDGGQIFYGSNGCIMAGCYGNSPRIFPETRMREVGRPKQMPPTIKGGNFQEWIRACKGGPAAGSNLVDYAGALTETVLLGNLAIRAGKRITWDAKSMRCVDNPAADAYISHPYRVF